MWLFAWMTATSASVVRTFLRSMASLSARITGRAFKLCIEVPDVDAYVAKLRDGGAGVLAELADQGWGERVACVEDPDGNPVHVRGSIADSDTGGS
jgi:uncharacterized glyoxalase superfamily protein PhnB